MNTPQFEQLPHIDALEFEILARKAGWDGDSKTFRWMYWAYNEGRMAIYLSHIKNKIPPGQASPL